MEKKHIIASLIVGLVSSGLVYANLYAYAHEFSGDDSASFLALVETIKVQLQLVESNLASNVTLAQEHAIDANEHLDNHTIEEIAERNERLSRDLPATLEDLQNSVTNSSAQEIQTKIQNITDLLGETVSARINSEQMGNSTVWALVIANLADSVVGDYGSAYGIQTEEDHDEESGNVTHNDTETMTEATSAEENITQEEEIGNNTNNMTTDVNATAGNQTIVSMAHYQSAQALAARTQQLFSEQVKDLAPANSTEFTADVEAGLARLKQAIDNKEPFTNVQVILHSEVHPNLGKTYNLQIIS
ncbi:MAG TPA: hypothetical protein VFH09_04215 [Nitrososphaera sp.]|nr:hypothetical protein [Nitrososphaera sp.]